MTAALVVNNAKRGNVNLKLLDFDATLNATMLLVKITNI